MWEDTEIHGYNTDAVYCRNPKKDYPIKNKDDKFTTDMIGKVFEKVGESPSDIEKNYRNNIVIKDYTLEKGTGTLVAGGAGCGKTSKLIKDAQESKNPIIFSFTNKAVDNIRNTADERLKNNIHTFDSYFNEFKSDADNIKLMDNKDVFIDEFSMVPLKWMTLIYSSFVTNNLKINLYGDTNQCNPVEGKSRLTYYCTKSPAIQDMCSVTVELEYIKGSNRYDQKTYNMLSKFLKTGQIKDQLGKYVGSFVNVCYYNSTRIEINKMCSDAFCERKQFKKVNFSYNRKKELYKVCAGTPVINMGR